MMKKLLILSLFCFCVCPSYAQKNFWRGVTHFKKPAAFETNIKAAVLRTEAALKLPGSPHIRIANLPGEPTVKLGGNVDNLPKLLSARMLSGKESYKGIKKNDTDIYLPVDLNTENPSFYKGLHLYDLKSIQNIFENGIEIDRVSDGMGYKIYFSGYVGRTISFSTNNDDENALLPTIIRFELPTWLDVYVHKRVWGPEDYIVHNDIRARYITDVMVFLEVNGKPDWYKVSLENDELIFTPAPSRVFTDDELIIHKFGRDE